jgi:peptide/nickel transport system ATP-binding protein
MTEPILAVRDLSVDARTPEGLRPVLEDVSFTLHPGETLCLAGESGSGKSLTTLSIMRLLSLKLRSGSIRLAERELTTLSERAMRRVRGGEIAMIFQEPMTSLNPVMTVGAQPTEAIRTHDGAYSRGAEARALAMLEAVHMTEPARRTGEYPHEFSGGQGQRICIARALALEPSVIVADESVSALDVSVRGQVLDLLLELQEEMGLAYLFISHDMAVIERMSHDVAVMRDGEFVEYGTRRQVFENPTQDYT